MSNASLLTNVTKAPARPKPWDDLDDRGVQILAALLQDPQASNKAVADLLGVSHNTTKAQYLYVREKLLRAVLQPSRTVLEELTIHFLEAKVKVQRPGAYDMLSAYLEASAYVPQYFMLKGRDVDYLVKVVTPGEAEFKEFLMAFKDKDFIETVYVSGTVVNQYDTGHHELSFLIHQE